MTKSSVDEKRAGVFFLFFFGSICDTLVGGSSSEALVFTSRSPD